MPDLHAREHLLEDRGVVRGIATDETRRIDLVDPELLRRQCPRQHDAIVPDRDVRLAAHSDLVEAAFAVHHRRAPESEGTERRRDRLAPATFVDADHLVAHGRGVGQRSEQVEDRAGTELATNRAGMPGGRVKPGCEGEADPGDLDASGDHRGVRLDRDAELLENIGRAALR